MLFGLSNDEVGYLIPKRQWDTRKPFSYGRKRAQYGEENSCGPEAAMIVMEGFARCVEGQGVSDGIKPEENLSGGVPEE